ncbi:MAG: SDR family oxidoreductase [Dermatophilaceae bacterium]|nr:SDR family oxidoreductase [Dermatophilaceae bacterium]
MAVVGATGGLGWAISRELARRGARLVLTGRDPAALRERSEELPGSASAVLDLHDPDAGDRLVAAATAAFGRLDVLVNAAGIVAFGPLADTPDVVIEELFLTNVIGPLWLLRRCLPLLQASQGTVVHLSAVVAEQPLPGMAAYSATKAALSAADAALARELRRAGIRVLDVRPPHTNTGLHERPLHGSVPRLAKGLDPEMVARTIADALAEPKRLQLAAADFAAEAPDRVASERITPERGTSPSGQSTQGVSHE